MLNGLNTYALRGMKSLLTVGALLMTLVGGVAANPTDPTVQQGTVNITPGASGVLTIEQLTGKAIVDWRTFSIRPNEIVRFLQPGQLSIILNRVTGTTPSLIEGQLRANGQVFLLNPNGLLFTPSSVVNTAGLLVSTLKMSNSDFMSGNYTLAQDPNMKLSSVVAKGTITVTDGGYAVLAAPLVSNEGLIVCNLGKVLIGAGERVTLNFDGRNLINWSIPGLTGQPGTVVVPPEALSHMLGQVITNHNVVEAGQIINNPDGTVSLVGASGVAVNNGQIRANGLPGLTAGAVYVDSAQSTYLGANSVISANGAGAGSDGGLILIDSRGLTTTEAGSRLTTTAEAGNRGGSIETSGDRVNLQGSVDPGASGTYLIDPTYLTITGSQGGGVTRDYLEGISSGTVVLDATNRIDFDMRYQTYYGYWYYINSLNMQSGVSLVFNTANLLLHSASPYPNYPVYGDQQYVTVTVNGSGSITANVTNIDMYNAHLVATGSGNITLNVAGNATGGGSGYNLTGDLVLINGLGNAQVGTAGTPITVQGRTATRPTRLDLGLTSDTQTIHLTSASDQALTFLGSGTSTASNGWANTTVNLTHAGGTVTLGNITAANLGVTATTINGSGTVTAGDVNLTATTGGITLGAYTVNNLTATASASNITATGVVTATDTVSLIASNGDISMGNINAWIVSADAYGSINGSGIVTANSVNLLARTGDIGSAVTPVGVNAPHVTTRTSAAGRSTYVREDGTLNTLSVTTNDGPVHVSGTAAVDYSPATLTGSTGASVVDFTDLSNVTMTLGAITATRWTITSVGGNMVWGGPAAGLDVQNLTLVVQASGADIGTGGNPIRFNGATNRILSLVVNDGDAYVREPATNDWVTLTSATNPLTLTGTPGTGGWYGNLSLLVTNTGNHTVHLNGFGTATKPIHSLYVYATADIVSLLGAGVVDIFATDSTTLIAQNVGTVSRPIRTQTGGVMRVDQLQSGGHIYLDNNGSPTDLYLQTNNGTVGATWGVGDYLTFAGGLLTGRANQAGAVTAENVFLTNTAGSITFDNSLGTAYQANGGILFVRAVDGSIEGGSNATNADVNLANGTLYLESIKGATTGSGSIGDLASVKLQSADMHVNAYTVGATSAADGIQLTALGDILHLDQIYAGATVNEPMSMTWGVCTVGAVTATSGTSAGSVSITGDGLLRMNHVAAGTTATGDGNVTILSTGGYDVALAGSGASGSGGVTALGDAVGIGLAAGNLLNTSADPTTANITATILDVVLTGTGNVGANPNAPGGGQMLVTDVDNIGMSVADGGAYVHDVGSTLWGYAAGHEVLVNATSSTQQVILVNDGTMVARDVRANTGVAPGTANTDISLFTTSGSNIVLGNVVAADSSGAGSHVTVVSSGSIINGRPTGDSPISPAPAGTYNVTATNVVLVGDSQGLHTAAHDANIGVAETSSGDVGRPIYIDATNLATVNTGGSTHVRNAGATHVTTLTYTDRAGATQAVSGMTSPQAINGDVVLRTENGDVNIYHTLTGANVVVFAGTASAPANGGNIVDATGGARTAIVTPGYAVLSALSGGNAARGHVGSPTTPLTIDAAGLSGYADGVYRLLDTRDVTVGGYFGVNDLVSSGASISLQTTTGNIHLAGAVEALGTGQTVSLDASAGSASITANGATSSFVQADNIVMWGANVGDGNPIFVKTSGGDPFLVSAGSSTNAGVVDVIGLTGNMLLVNGMTIDSGAGAHAVNLQGLLVCFTSAGTLEDTVLITGPLNNQIGLQAGGAITLDHVVGGANTSLVSLNAGTSGSGGIVNNSGLDTPVVATTVVLNAADSIALRITADNLAAHAGGDLLIRDNVSFTVTQQALLARGGTVAGVSGENIILTSPNGTITLLRDIYTNSSTTGNAAVYAAGAIILGANNIRAGTNSGYEASVESGGSVTGTSGGVVGHDVAISANGEIGGATGGVLLISAARAAATSATGRVYLADMDTSGINSGLTLTNLDILSTAAGAGPATQPALHGLTAATDVFAHTQGSMLVSTAPTVGIGNAIGLEAGGDITLGQVVGSTNVSLVSVNAGVGTNRVGTIIDATGNPAGTPAVVASDDIVLLTHGWHEDWWGWHGADMTLAVSAPNIAFNAGAGDINLTVAQPFVVTTLDTFFTNIHVVGGTSRNDLHLTAPTGDIVALSQIANTYGNVLVTTPTGTITLNGGNVTAGSGSVGLYANGAIELGTNSVNAASGTASVVSVTDTVTEAAGGRINASRVVLRTVNDVGSAGDAFDINTNELSATSSTGLLRIDNAHTGLTIATFSTVDTSSIGGAAATSVAGITTPQWATVQTAGNLLVNTDVTAGLDVMLTAPTGAISLDGGDVATTSATHNVAMYSRDNINLNNNDVTAGATSGEASVVSSGGAITDGSGTVSASQVALWGRNGVGANGAPVNTATPLLASFSSNGSVYLSNTGTVTVGTFSTLDTTSDGGIASALVTGIESTPAVVDLTVLGGDLTVLNPITAGTNAYVRVPDGHIAQDGTHPISAVNAYIMAGHDIGASGWSGANTSLLTHVTRDLVIKSTGGAVYVDDNVAVQRVNVITAGGNAYLTFIDQGALGHLLTLTSGVLNVTGTVEGTSVSYHNIAPVDGTQNITVQRLDLVGITGHPTYAVLTSDNGNIIQGSATPTAADFITLTGRNVGGAGNAVLTQTTGTLYVNATQSGGDLYVVDQSRPTDLFLITNNGTVDASWGTGDFVTFTAGALRGRANQESGAIGENVTFTNTNGDITFDNSTGTAYQATRGALVVRALSGRIEGGAAAGTPDVDVGTGTVSLIAVRTGASTGSIGDLTSVKLSGANMHVNAYTVGGVSAADGIHLRAIGDLTHFDQIYAGATATTPYTISSTWFDLTYGVCMATPINTASQQSAGSVTITGDGRLGLHDVVAGTAATGNGDVTVTSTGGGDVLIYGDPGVNGTGGIVASGDAVTISSTAGGGVLNMNTLANPLAADITATTLDIFLSGGRGDVGANPCVLTTNQLLVTNVSNVGMSIADGGAWVHNLGATTWGYATGHEITVSSSSPVTDEVVLVSDGASNARHITSQTDISLFTNNGAAISLGNVVASNTTAGANTVAVISTGSITNGLAGAAAVGNYNITATNVVLVADSDHSTPNTANDLIGTGETSQTDVSGPIYINAPHLATSNDSGPTYVRDAQAVEVTSLSYTDLTCNTVTINGMTSPTEPDSGWVDNNRPWYGDVILRTETGDVTLSQTITAHNVLIVAGTPTVGTNAGSIIDGSGGARTDIVATGAVGLVATSGGDPFAGHVGTASAPLTLTTPGLSIAAQGLVRVSDTRSVTVGSYWGIEGVTSTSDILMLAGGTITVDSHIVSSGGDIALQTTAGDINLYNHVSATAATHTVSLDTSAGGGSISDPNNLTSAYVEGDHIVLWGANVGATHPIYVRPATADPFTVSGGSSTNTVGTVVEVDGLAGNMQITTGTTLDAGAGAHAVTVRGGTVCYESAGTLEDVALISGPTGNQISLSAGGTITVDQVLGGVNTSLVSLDAGTAVSGTVVNNTGNAVLLTATTAVMRAADDLDLRISAANLAARSGGNLTIRNDQSFTVTQQALLCSGSLVNGVSGANVVLTSPNGSITLAADVYTLSGTNGNVAVYGAGDVSLGANSIRAGTTSGEASVESGGAITGAAGQITAHDVALSASGNITGATAGTDLNISAARVAATSTTGQIDLHDLDTGNVNAGIELTTLNILTTSAAGGPVTQPTLSSLTAAHDACLLTEGALMVSLTPTVGNGYSLGLEAGANITIGTGQVLGSSNVYDVTLNAGRNGTGTIVDNAGFFGATPVIVSNHGVALVSHGSSPAGDINLTVSTPNMAVAAGGFLDIFNVQSYNVTTMYTLCTNTRVSGMTAGDGIRLTKETGDIIVLDPVFSGGNIYVVAPAGSITLAGGDITSTNGNVAMYGLNSIILNNNSVSAAGEVSIVSETGAITDDTGVVTGTTVALSSATGIGADGDPIHLAAGTVAATSLGGIYLSNVGDLAIGTVSTISTTLYGGVASTPIAGITSSADICVSTTGALTVTHNVSAGGNVHLVSSGSTVDLNGGTVATTSGSGNVAIWASNGIALGADNVTAGATSGQASIVSASGAITGGTGQVSGSTVSLAAASGLGTAGTAIRLNTPTLAAGGGTGGVYLRNAGALTVSALSTLDTAACGGAVSSLVTGVTADGDIALATTGGALTVAQSITGGANIIVTAPNSTITLSGGNIATTNGAGHVALHANGTISLGDNSVTAGSTSGEASLVSVAGGVTEGTGHINGHTVVLRTEGDAGTFGAPLTIEANQLAVRSANGSVEVINLGPSLIVGTFNTVNTSTWGGASATSTVGASALTDICIRTGGALTVSSDVTNAGSIQLIASTPVSSTLNAVILNGGDVYTTSNSGNVAMFANGDIRLGGAIVTAGSTSGRVSLVSTDGAITNNGGTVSGSAVVMTALDSIGTRNASIVLSTPLVAASSTNGSIYLSNFGGLTVGEVSTIDTSNCGGGSASLVSGVTALNGDILVTTTGSLLVSKPIAAGHDIFVVSSGGTISLAGGDISTTSDSGNVALYAYGNVNLGSNSVSAGVVSGTVSIISPTGTVTATSGTINTYRAVIDTHTSLGAGGTPFTINAPQLALYSTTGTTNLLNDYTGLTIGTYSTIDTQWAGGVASSVISGVTNTASVVHVTTSGNLVIDGNVTGGGDVFVVAPTGTITMNGITVSSTSGSGNVAVYGRDNVIMGSSSVTAGADGAASIVSATGAITGGTGTVSGTSVVLSGATGIGVAGTPIKLNTATVAATTPAGGIYLSNTGPLTVGTLQTLDTTEYGGAVPVTVTGITATTGVVALTTTGALAVSNDITGGSHVSLVSTGGGITLNGANVATTGIGGNVALYAAGPIALGGNDITAGATTGTASLVSTGGAITTTTGVVSGNRIALSGATGVGTATHPMNLVTPLVAATTNTGGVYLGNVGSLTIGTVATISTSAYGGAAATNVTGLRSTAGDVCVTTTGDLTVNQNLTAGGDVVVTAPNGAITLDGGNISSTSASGDVAIYADGNISVGTNNVTAGATSGEASIVSATGAISGTTGVVGGYQVALSVPTHVGSEATPLLTNTRVLAVSSAGEIEISNTGALTLDALYTLDTSGWGGVGAALISNVGSSGSDVCITTSGALTVNVAPTVGSGATMSL